MKNKLYLIKIKKCNGVVPVLMNTCPAVSIAQSRVRTLILSGHPIVVIADITALYIFFSVLSYCINTAFKVHINTCSLKYPLYGVLSDFA